MFAADVMTAPVVTVEETASVAEVARLMSERRITGLPVVDAAGKLVGMVTDGDLLHRAELGAERRSEGLLDTLFLNRPDAKDYVQARGRMAADVMTRTVYAVRPDTPLDRVADLFETRRIRRAPVVDDGKLVGVVSRADLVRALIAAADKPPPADLSDRQLRDLVRAEFKRLSFGLRAEGSVLVKDGIVHLGASCLTRRSAAPCGSRSRRSLASRASRITPAGCSRPSASTPGRRAMWRSWSRSDEPQRAGEARRRIA